MRVEVFQNRGRDKSPLEFCECFVLLRAPVKFGFVPFWRLGYGCAYLGEVFGEPSVEVCKTNKNLYFFYGSQGFPVHY